MKINIINKVDIYILIASTLILSTMLFYSISSDLSAFIQGGMILHNGGSLYVDYFDVKPPFVYYFFELLYTFFAKNIILYRLFDVFYQLVFLISSLYIFKKISLDSKYIRAYLILMPLSYVILNNFNVFRTESLLYLPLIWYFYLTLAVRNKKLKHFILKGFILGIMINLKYTFGLLILADFLVLYRNEIRLKSILYGVLIQLLTALTFTFLCFLPILIKGNFGAFLNFLGYMKVYTANPPYSLSHFNIMIKTATVFFTDSYSIILLICTILAIFISSKKKIKKQLGNLDIEVILIFVLILFATVVIERKMLSYHEQRLYPLLLILPSIGIITLYEKLTKYRFITLIPILAIVFIFSPIPRFINLLRLPYYKLMNQEDKYYNYFVDGMSGNILYKQFILSKYVNSNFDTDKLLLIDTGGNELVVFMNKDYKYAFPQSAFYLVKMAPQYLVDRAFDDIKDADIIILQKNDNLPIMFFNDDTSLTALEKRKPLWNYLNANFKQDTVIAEDFLIFIRNKTDIK